MIYITGDTHGNIDFPRIKEYFSKIYVTKKDVLIILGDAGVVWSQKECYIWEYYMLGLTVLFIDGNHENFTLLNRFPNVEIFGAKAHRLYDNIYHIKRGEILKISGKTFFCMGGATSIDKSRRIEGVSWWNEENISEDDIANAKMNLAKVNYKVDYVLTHAGPSSIVYASFHYRSDPNSSILEELLCRIEFKEWFFGHYHEDKRYKNFRCFYYDVLVLPYLFLGKDSSNKVHEFHEREGKKYLYSMETYRAHKITGNELSEWYLNGYYGYYYSLKGVKDFAFTPSPFDNHIDKDSRIYLSYDKKISKNENLYPSKKDEERLVCLWRCSLKEAVKGLEKYSPDLDYTALKEQINLVYDQYNNRRELEHFDHDGLTIRPYLDVETRRYKGRYGDEEAKYQLIQNGKVLTQFISLEKAKVGLSCYLKHNLNMKNDFTLNENEEILFEMDLPDPISEKLILKKF